jgi:hypothetical protein
MSSGSGRESIITVNDVYNYTDYFIVHDVNSNDVVARQLYKQLEAPRRRGLTRVRVLLAKVREH